MDTNETKIKSLHSSGRMSPNLGVYNNNMDYYKHATDFTTYSIINNHCVKELYEESESDSNDELISDPTGGKKDLKKDQTLQLQIWLQDAGLPQYYSRFLANNITVDKIPEICLKKNKISTLVPSIGDRVRLCNYARNQPILKHLNHRNPDFGGPFKLAQMIKAPSNFSQKVINVQFIDLDGNSFFIDVTPQDNISLLKLVLSRCRYLKPHINYKLHDLFDVYDSDTELNHAICKEGTTRFWIKTEDQCENLLQGLSTIEQQDEDAKHWECPVTRVIPMERPTSEEVTRRLSEYFPTIDVSKQLGIELRNSMVNIRRKKLSLSTALDEVPEADDDTLQPNGSLSILSLDSLRTSVVRDSLLKTLTKTPSRNSELVTNPTSILQLYDLYDQIAEEDFFQDLESIESAPTDYLEGKLIGKGSFGAVFLAFNQNTGDILAVKKLHIGEDEKLKRELSDSLRVEISTLRELDHPNIVKFKGFKQDDTFFNIFLEYVSGGSLSSRIKHYGAYREPMIQHYMKQCLEGLKYMHSKNIIHRDIKSANILVDSNNDIKISDFGISRIEDLTQKRASMKGTAYWMAPEIARGVSGCTTKVDIWSLGCVAIELLSGKHPFPNLNPFQAIYHLGLGKLPQLPSKTISTSLKSFIEACLQVDPGKRSTAEALLQHPFITDPDLKL